MKKPSFDLQPLKDQVQQQPLVAAGIASVLLSGAAKLMNANTSRKNAKTWRREVNRREKKQK
jgi:hypothetical protein